jgi:hypothetical protein
VSLCPQIRGAAPAGKNVYETVHRGILYTNYRMLPDDVISTSSGRLLAATGWNGIATAVCELIERLPKHSETPLPGTVISVGPDTFIHDFAAISSFALQATFTPDQSLAQRLLTAQRPALGIPALPNQYVAKVFDSAPPYNTSGSSELSSLVDELLGLKRTHYEGALRAIRRYVTAMHRLADDLDLAYALLVASIESLAQEFDGFVPEWKDYDPRKRKSLDEALKNASDETASAVRKAILDSEHVAIRRRFSEFCMSHLGTSFFRQEAAARSAPVGKSDLALSLKRAYELRSRYVHSLAPLPKNLVSNPSFNDISIVDFKPHLTFEGLARVSRTVIREFIGRAPKTKQEQYEFTNAYPNLLRMQMAPQYWIHNANDFSHKNSYLYLNAFLSQVTEHLLDQTKKVTDIRAVTTKIEALLPTLAKPEQRRPMLLLYYLFIYCLPRNERSEAVERIRTYLSDLDTPSSESLALHTYEERMPDWQLNTTEEVLQNYMERRYSSEGLDAGPILGAAMALTVAEMYRPTDEGSARRLISWAVDQFPGLRTLRKYETSLTANELAPIQWRDILLPNKVSDATSPVTRPKRLEKLNRRLASKSKCRRRHRS